VDQPEVSDRSRIAANSEPPERCQQLLPFTPDLSSVAMIGIVPEIVVAQCLEHPDDLALLVVH
jgi:hypothetical protein